MRQFILDFSKQFRKGIEAAENAEINGLMERKKDFQNLVVCGMGGSALPGEILKSLPHFNLPIIIHRSYGLPRETNENSLIFVSSYSGNTEEAVDALNEAVNKNFNIAGFSDEGEVKKLCKDKNIPYVDYPQEKTGFEPRLALGYSFAAMFRVLDILGHTPCDTKQKLEELAAELSGLSEALEKEGEALAKKIFGKLILIYAPYNLKGLPYIWKINFNETVKIFAFSNCYPELNHNEMQGFENAAGIFKEKICVLNLIEKETDQRILKRMEITFKIIKENKIDAINIEFRGKNILEKIFSSITLSMWTSYYLALLYKIDPLEINIIEDFKKLLKQ